VEVVNYPGATLRPNLAERPVPLPMTENQGPSTRH